MHSFAHDTLQQYTYSLAIIVNKGIRIIHVFIAAVTGIVPRDALLATNEYDGKKFVQQIYI